MIFQPLTNYTGFQHVLGAGAQFVHPGNGTVYGCACEQKKGAQQNLTIYRRRPGANAWEVVKRYLGTVQSAGHITMGGCVIDQAGSLIVMTSLIIPGAPVITGTGFQGTWIEEPNIDDPWTGGGEPGPQGEPGVGGMILLDKPATADAWHARAMVANEGLLVNIPALFGVPAARNYKVRLSIQAGAANVTARVGTLTAPYFLTTTTQAKDTRIDTQGDVPGAGTWVSCVGGMGVVWLQIVGYAG